MLIYSFAFRRLIEIYVMNTVSYCVVCSECSDLVATCSAQDIRLWNTRKAQELLRITVHNMVCNAVSVMRDGKSVVSGIYERFRFL